MHHHWSEDIRAKAFRYDVFDTSQTKEFGGLYVPAWNEERDFIGKANS